jgi:hypothetical protein
VGDEWIEEFELGWSGGLEFVEIESGEVFEGVGLSGFGNKSLAAGTAL